MVKQVIHLKTLNVVGQRLSCWSTEVNSVTSIYNSSNLPENIQPNRGPLKMEQIWKRNELNLARKMLVICFWGMQRDSLCITWVLLTPSYVIHQPFARSLYEGTFLSWSHYKEKHTLGLWVFSREGPTPHCHVTVIGMASNLNLAYLSCCDWR